MKIFVAFALLACASLVCAQPSEDDKKAAIEKSWTIAPPVHTSKEKSWCSSVIIEKGGRVIIKNRGILQSAEKPANPRVSCAWKYMSKDDTSRDYHDELWIVLRTTGERNAWPYDPKDGIAVIVRPESFEPLVIGECKEKASPRTLVSRKNIILFRDGFCSVAVEDRGDVIMVFIEGKEALMHKVSPGKPGHVLVFNGHPYPGPKTTYLESFTLAEWKPDK